VGRFSGKLASEEGHMTNRILILGNIDEDLGHNTRGIQRLEHIALGFHTGEFFIVGQHHVIARLMDTIVGVRWPYFVVLQGYLYGPDKTRLKQGYVGRIEGLGEILMREVYPK
jgi:hypothetical protein